MGLFLGIDFGTSTNYVTRWFEDGSVKAVPNLGEYGKDVFQNAIFYKYNSEKNTVENIIGETAKKQMVVSPRNGIMGVKRKLIEDNWTYYIPALSSNCSSVDVSTDIFSHIKENVSKNHGNTDIDGVVISVPYAYGNKERLKIKRAAERAGLKVLDLIEEPVAAALSYGVIQKESTMGRKEKIIVFDFGGGTLDITVFEYNRSAAGDVSIEVLNTEGMRELGGQLIDELMVNKIIEKTNLDLLEIADEERRKQFQHELTKAVVDAKEGLLWDDEADVDVEGIKSVHTTVTIEEFENWLRGAGIIEKIRFAVEDVLIDADLEASEIDRVLLVGGSSNIRIVKEELENIFEQEIPECDMEKDRLVGYGAGVYCGMLVQKKSKIHIIQKLSYALGVRVGAKFDKLIEKNEKYGSFSKPRKYAMADNKNLRDIEVYQGNSNDIKKCFLIGKIPVSDLKLDAGQEIEIELGTDKSGMVAYKVFTGGDMIAEGELE